MSYDKKITIKKGADGGLEGGLIALLTIVIVGFLKRYVMDMDPGTENTVTLLVGSVVAAVLLAVTRAIRNWLKHRNDVQPAPIENEPVEDTSQPEISVSENKTNETNTDGD